MLSSAPHGPEEPVPWDKPVPTPTWPGDIFYLNLLEILAWWHRGNPEETALYARSQRSRRVDGEDTNLGNFKHATQKQCCNRPKYPALSFYGEGDRPTRVLGVVVAVKPPKERAATP